MERITNQVFDEERALYNLKDAVVESCKFEGPKDGESVLKEARNVTVSNSSFSLRYPLWHVDTFTLNNTSMDNLTRAAIWYSKKGFIKDSIMNGIKAVRECSDIVIDNTQIDSPEFGWKSNNIKITNSTIKSEYLFFDTDNVILDNVKMSGKYSFQYMNNLTITNSNLDTKDAFWHSKNVYVKDSIVKGEYLGWYSDNLTLENCKIIGTQPLCYVTNLTLINCTTEDCDLSFEYSDVNATIKGNIVSIKNPRSGNITCDSYDELILEDSIMNSEFTLNNKKYSK